VIWVVSRLRKLAFTVLSLNSHALKLYRLRRLKKTNVFISSKLPNLKEYKNLAHARMKRTPGSAWHAATRQARMKRRA
jgi:hypothetical protein